MTKLKITYLTLIHVALAVLIYNYNKPEPVIREYSATYCYNGVKCANTFEQYKKSEEAELTLKEAYLLEQWGVLSKELDTVQGVLRPNLIVKDNE